MKKYGLREVILVQDHEYPKRVSIRIEREAVEFVHKIIKIQ